MWLNCSERQINFLNVMLHTYLTYVISQRRLKTLVSYQTEKVDVKSNCVEVQTRFLSVIIHTNLIYVIYQRPVRYLLSYLSEKVNLKLNCLKR